MEDSCVISICDIFSRASASFDRVCALWRPTRLPEEEPWIK